MTDNDIFDNPESFDDQDDDYTTSDRDEPEKAKAVSHDANRPDGVKEFFSVNSASVRELNLASPSAAASDLTTLGRIVVDRFFLSKEISSFLTLTYLLEKHDPVLGTLLENVARYYREIGVRPDKTLPTQAHLSLLSGLIALMLARYNRLTKADITDVVSACLLYGYKSDDHQTSLDLALKDGLIDRHITKLGQATSLPARTAMQKSCIGLTIGKRIVSDAIMAPCAALLTETAIRLTDTYISDDQVHYDHNHRHGKTLSLLSIIGPMHSATRYTHDKPEVHVIEARRKRIYRDVNLAR